MNERIAEASPRRWARIAGVLYLIVIVGGLCYLANGPATFLSPGFAAGLFPYIQTPSGLAELLLCFRLLVIGVNVLRWNEQANAAGASIRT